MEYSKKLKLCNFCLLVTLFEDPLFMLRYKSTLGVLGHGELYVVCTWKAGISYIPGKAKIFHILL